MNSFWRQNGVLGFFSELSVVTSFVIEHCIDALCPELIRFCYFIEFSTIDVVGIFVAFSSILG